MQTMFSATVPSNSTTSCGRYSGIHASQPDPPESCVNTWMAATSAAMTR